MKHEEPLKFNMNKSNNNTENKSQNAIKNTFCVTKETYLVLELVVPVARLPGLTF